MTDNDFSDYVVNAAEVYDSLKTPTRVRALSSLESMDLYNPEMGRETLEPIAEEVERAYSVVYNYMEDFAGSGLVETYSEGTPDLTKFGDDILQVADSIADKSTSAIFFHSLRSPERIETLNALYANNSIEGLVESTGEHSKQVEFYLREFANAGLVRGDIGKLDPNSETEPDAEYELTDTGEKILLITPLVGKQEIDNEEVGKLLEAN